MKKVLLVALACTGAVPVAQAQTGRIAHYSHGGSVGTLAATEELADNFGYSVVENEWKEDSIVWVNNSVIEHRGQVRLRFVSGGKPASAWKRQVDAYRAADEQMLEGLFPSAVLISANKKKKNNKKSVGNTRAFSLRPFQYSFWRSLSEVTVLGAVCWLLGKKRVA